MASLESVPDGVLDSILSRVPRRFWQSIQNGQVYCGLGLVCKRWKEWVKEQDGRERLQTQPKERLLVLCYLNSCRIRLLAAEGFLSIDRTTLTIHVLPHGVEGQFAKFSLDSRTTFRDRDLEGLCRALLGYCRISGVSGGTHGGDQARLSVMV